MTIKVFQVQKTKNKFNKICCIGKVVVPRYKTDFIEESIWDLFNWTCWMHDSKRNIYNLGIRKGFRKNGYRCFPNKNAQGFCNSDIFFKLNNVWWIARPVGWETANSYEEAVELINKRF